MTTTTPPKNAVIVPESNMAEINKLDECAKAASRQLVECDKNGNEMAKALVTAKAMKMLRQLLTDALMIDLMSIQGTKLGYRTDKDTDGGYSQAIVRDVLIAAMIRGLRPTGNEINIIAGNLYVTKEGFTRLLAELPGFADFKFQMGVPQSCDGGALVPCDASWKWYGKLDVMKCTKTDEGDYRIAVRVNKGMGSDAILGKAESKLLRRIYQRCTGSAVGVDPDEPEATETPKIAETK